MWIKEYPLSEIPLLFFSLPSKMSYFGNGTTVQREWYYTQNCLLLTVSLFSERMWSSRRDLNTKWDNKNMVEDRRWTIFLLSHFICKYLIFQWQSSQIWKTNDEASFHLSTSLSSIFSLFHWISSNLYDPNYIRVFCLDRKTSMSISSSLIWLYWITTSLSTKKKLHLQIRKKK